jgi:hypothetical protein
MNQEDEGAFTVLAGSVRRGWTETGVGVTEQCPYFIRFRLTKSISLRGFTKAHGEKVT